MIQTVKLDTPSAARTGPDPAPEVQEHGFAGLLAGMVAGAPAPALAPPAATNPAPPDRIEAPTRDERPREATPVERRDPPRQSPRDAEAPAPRPEEPDVEPLPKPPPQEAQPAPPATTAAATENGAEGTLPVTDAPRPPAPAALPLPALPLPAAAAPTALESTSSAAAPLAETPAPSAIPPPAPATVPVEATPMAAPAVVSPAPPPAAEALAVIPAAEIAREGGIEVPAVLDPAESAAEPLMDEANSIPLADPPGKLPASRIAETPESSRTNPTAPATIDAPESLEAAPARAANLTESPLSEALPPRMPNLLRSASREAPAPPSGPAPGTMSVAMKELASVPRPEIQVPIPLQDRSALMPREEAAKREASPEVKATETRASEPVSAQAVKETGTSTPAGQELPAPPKEAAPGATARTITPATPLVAPLATARVDGLSMLAKPMEAALKSAPMAQMEGTIKWMLRTSEPRAELQLHPESLGKVMISIKVDGREVHAKVWASEPGTVPLLQEHKAFLEVSLQEAGMSLGSFDLHQGQQGQGAHTAAQGAAWKLPEGGLEPGPESRQEAPIQGAVASADPHQIEIFA